MVKCKKISSTTNSWPNYMACYQAPSSNGGSNYAAGGATATPELNPQDNTADQVRQWLAKNGGKADHNGLYIHYSGRRKRSGVAAIAQPNYGTKQIKPVIAPLSAAAQVGPLIRRRRAGRGCQTYRILVRRHASGGGGNHRRAMQRRPRRCKSGVRCAGGVSYARFRQSATGDPQGVGAGGGCNGKQQSVYIQQPPAEQLPAGYEKAAGQASA